MHCPKSHLSKKVRLPRERGRRTTSGILSGFNDWELLCDLDSLAHFPQKVLLTELRPDIVLMSEKGKRVIAAELTIPWEDNFDCAHERKAKKYDELIQECRARGWTADCFPIEIGCRGLVGHSFLAFVGKLETGCRGILKREVSNAAIRASAWIWQKHRSEYRAAKR